jgi:uncharacterized HhH-GPD family protein
MVLRTLEIPSAKSKDGAMLFLLGILFNQGQRAELAWRGPGLLQSRLGFSSFEELISLGETRIIQALATKPAIHRMARTMGKNVDRLAQSVSVDYGGDARKIWVHIKSEEGLTQRLCAIPGIGPHKAAVGVFLLQTYQGLKIPSNDPVANILKTCPALHEAHMSGGIFVKK